MVPPEEAQKITEADRSPKPILLEFHHVQMPVFLFLFLYFMTSYELGKEGEELATDYLRHHGMQILEQRWKDHSYEMDIIAFDPQSDEMVFVEVKTRSSGVWGRPEDAIDYKKIRRCVIAADYYMRSRNLNYPVRFDVFAIVLPNGGKAKIDYFKDAFYAPLG